MEIESFDISELSQVAKELLENQESRIWCFYGEMGAGKTTLIKEICSELGVRDAMSSPTFSIVNEYQTIDSGRIYHFDFYRIKGEEEAIDIGIDDYFYSGDFCFIEWPEKIEMLLPEQYLEINIKLVNETKRSLSFNLRSEEN